jgi:hypothetical protein
MIGRTDPESEDAVMAALELVDQGPGDKPPSEDAARGPTVCAECVYFYNMTPSLNLMPLAVCTHSMFARPAKVDYVTGRTLNETRPNCAEINKGECPGFEKDRSRFYLMGVGLLVVGLLLAAMYFSVG